MLKLFKHLGLSLLLFWLCIFTVFAQEFYISNTIREPEPPFKAILDAPSLQTPSQPYYTTNLQELGYENLEQLLNQSVQTQSAILSLAWSPSGQLASGSQDGMAKLWDTKTGKLLTTLQAQSSVNSLAWSPSGQLASGSQDGTVKLWDANTGELLTTLQVQGAVFSLAWSPSGQLASGSSDGAVQLWDVKTGKLLTTLQAQGRVMSLAWSPSGQLASGSMYGTVQLWDTKAGELLTTLQARSKVFSLAWSPSGQLASGSLGSTVKLWDTKASKLLRTLQAESSINALAWSPSGQLTSGSDYGLVQLWDTNTGELLTTLQAQSGVTSLAWSPSGQLASGSGDGMVQLWDAKTGKLAQLLIAQSNSAWLNVKRTGEILRADEGKILRQATIVAEGQYIDEALEKDKDYKPTGKILKNQAVYQSFKWHYLLFPKSQTSSLSINLDQADLDASAEKANFFSLQLTNTSAEPIYHPQIIETTSNDNSLKIISAAYLPTYPQTVAIPSVSTVIPAGKTIKLAARVIGNTSQPVPSGEYEIPVTVAVSGGDTKTVLLKVNYHTADVQVVSSDLSTDTNTLSIQLKNQGSMALPKAYFYLQDQDKKLNLPSQTLEGIPAQTEAPPLAFTLPKDLSKEQLEQLQLEIRPMRPPLYTQWTIPLTLSTIPMYQQLGLTIAALVLLGFTVFYFRRYRHPLVLGLSDQPKAVHTLALEQLAEAQLRLKQTGRLKSILENADVSAATFQTAIDFPKQTAEQKAQIIAKRLHAQITEQLTPELWILKLPESFMLNLNRFLLYFPSVPAEDVFNTLYALPQAEGRVRVIIGKDASYQRKLLNTTQDRSNKYVAPQSKQITELLLSPQPEAVFAKILAEQLALQQLSPYQIGGGVNKEAIFFGRRELIAQIINRDPANYLIVGGRQMGKSSLLKAIERRYAENPQVRVFYQTLSNETLIPRLAAELDLLETDSAYTLAQALEARLKTEGKRYIFLIDEADLFIQHEQAQNYPILSLFRRLSEQGQCNFILAGFWQLYQHAVLDYQSPLRNFGEVLEVGALEQDACEQLASKPMQTLNLSYANSSLVQELISQCGQRANLIAYVCRQIIQQLDPSQRVIEAGDVHRVLAGRDLQKRLIGWSVGIGELEQAYDRLVVYSTIQQASFSSGELMQQLDKQGVKFDSAELERALSRLELAFVLKKTQNRYSYCVPLFVEMMGEDDLAVRRERELGQWMH